VTPDGNLSRTVFHDRLKAVVFGFAQGQEHSEHTPAKLAMLFFVKGEATVVLGDDVQEAQTETWVHTAAGLKHSIKAKAPVVMLKQRDLQAVNRKCRCDAVG
jgi:quercetin dioxygenase-like cupin family protein